MSPHLAHFIPWDTLVSLISHPAEPGIAIPVRSCGRIHADTSSIRQKLAHHAYLTRHVCDSSDCMPENGVGVFYKSPAPKEEVVLIELRRDVLVDSGWNTHDGNPTRTWSQWQPAGGPQRRVRHFVDGFVTALHDVGESDYRAASERHPMSTRQACEAAVADVRQSSDYNSFWGDCDVVYHFLERGDAHVADACGVHGVLDLSAIRAECFGSQAVGNFWNFLLHYLLWVYLGTNAVLAAGQARTSPESLNKFMEQLRYCCSYDCDGRTFVAYARRGLVEGTFLVDGDATRDMLKRVFRFMAAFAVMERRGLGVDLDEWKVSWAERILSQLRVGPGTACWPFASYSFVR